MVRCRHGGTQPGWHCWGGNDTWQLGVEADSPDPVEPLPGREWQDVAAGGFHTCAVEAGGALWCRGAREHGQAGWEDPARRLPAQVGEDTDWRSARRAA